MTTCSETYAMVLNLYHAAVIHKETCPGQSCNVSLLSLKRAAEMLRSQALDRRELSCHEIGDIDHMFRTWPD